MLDITFVSNSSLQFQAELTTGTWVDTSLVANEAGTSLNLNSFSPTYLDVTSNQTSHVFRAQEDPGDPFLVIRVTNQSGDLEVRVPGQSYPTIPANSSVVITYPRVGPLVKKE
jgi:hypothetical protein